MVVRPKTNLHLKLDGDRKFVSITYPGKVNNVENMCKNFGGIQNIEKVFNDKSSRLSLKFRPNDPSCKPVLSNKKNGISLLLRVKKYKRKDKDEYCYYSEFIGTITTTYEFTAFCDYQYLPVMKDKQSNQLVDVTKYTSVNTILETLRNVTKPLDAFDKESPLFLPPLVFSRTDTAQVYNYRDLCLIKDSYQPCCAYVVNVGEKVPQTPHPEAENILDRLDPIVKKRCDELKELFRKRPIWSRKALQNVSQCTHYNLINILPLCAYYCATGPWRTLWIRLGYDPSNDPDAFRYQIIDFRIRRGKNYPSIPVPTYRSSLTTRPINRTEKKTRRYEEKNLLNEKGENPKVSDDQRHKFIQGKLPAYRQICYQYCDIEMEGFEKLLRIERTKNFSSKSGWLLEETSNKVRQMLEKDVNETCKSLKPDCEFFDESDDEDTEDEDVEEEEDEDDDEEDFDCNLPRISGMKN